MAAPFEDEVIKFIAGRRPLKLAFLLVAGIGVASSAYKALEPISVAAKPTLFRALGVELPRADRERLSCAYFSGAAQWDMPNSNRVAKSRNAAAVSENIQHYQARLSKCMAALGQLPPSAWAPASLTEDELARSASATNAALNTFSGKLQSKDRLTYLGHQFANDTAYVLTQLAPQSPDDRVQLELYLPGIEVDRAHRMKETIEEAQSLCPCRLPRIEVASSTYKALLDSARLADDALTKYLR